MTYLALLRGINVGGNKKVEMPRLKTVFEKAGLEEVQTYINTGNVIFQSQSQKPKELVKILEQAIETEFGFHVKVLLRSKKEFDKVVAALPDEWTNDASMKTDIMFLWEEIDDKKILDQLTINPDIDQILYVKGAILWNVDRHYLNQSGMEQLVGTKLYTQMTVRNCNTTRKLYHLMK